jgi:hypothetical protein
MGLSAREATPQAALPASAYPSRLSGDAPNTSLVRATAKKSDALRVQAGSLSPAPARRRNRRARLRAGGCGAQRGAGARRKNIWPVSGAATPLYRPPTPSAASVFCASRRCEARQHGAAAAAAERAAPPRPPRLRVPLAAAPRAGRLAPRPRAPPRLRGIYDAVVDRLVRRLRLQQHLQRVKRVSHQHDGDAARRARHNILGVSQRARRLRRAAGQRARVRRCGGAACSAQRACAEAQQGCAAQHARWLAVGAAAATHPPPLQLRRRSAEEERARRRGYASPALCPLSGCRRAGHERGLNRAPRRMVLRCRQQPLCPCSAALSADLHTRAQPSVCTCADARNPRCVCLKRELLTV